MKKRLLALLLALVLVTGLLPVTALAEETSPASTITVSFTAQAADAFLCAPQLGVTVASDLAERYGYTDSVEGVSALDVLVKAHEVIFGEDFTEETKDDYLTVDGSLIEKTFGEETMNCFYTINGQQPHDDVLVDMLGVPGGKSYTGYAINQAAVNNGDLVEFWIFQDSYGLDKYPLFQLGDEFVTALQGIAGQALDLTLKYYWIGYYGCVPMETLKATPRQIKILEDAQLAWVNTDDGTTSPIDGTTVEEDGEVTLTLPDTAGSYYLTVDLKEEDVIMPLITVSVVRPGTAITVPGDATLFVGSKTKHFVAFTEAEPVGTVNNGDGSITYYYDLKNGTYNYRVSGEEYITYAGKFTKSAADYTLSVTAEHLQPEGKTKTSVERNVSANNNYNVADILLNINPAGWLKLANVGDSHQLVNLRSWEATDTLVGNYFIEPDYHYTVLDETGAVSDSVVSVSDGGLVTARGEGAAIVLVTYDAFQYAGAAGGPFFGAIWSENTGVFVVSVGEGDSGIITGMTLNAGKNSTDTKLSGDAVDAEHDVIYFTGDSGSYTFTPGTEGCAVSVAVPGVSETGMTFSGFSPVSANADGSVTVPLAQGRNIVKLTKDGKSAYQVITAKKLTITAPEYVVPGETVSVKLDTVFHPANKLASVYNMSAVAVYTDVDGYAGKLVGGASAQYNFAATEKAQTVGNVLTRTSTAWSTSYKAGDPITVPEDWAEESFTLSGGSIIAVGLGDPYGNHRGITPEQGKDPNFNASLREAYLGQLPDITIPVMLSKSVTALSVTTPPAKTEYSAGDSFDAAGMVIHAVYSDGTESDVSSYTISPEALSENTAAVTVSYGGKSLDVPVTVTPPAITGLTVTTPPARTAYKAGDTFDPTGMVVTATYANGKSATVEDYSLEPQRALAETDEQITVKLGEFSATTPITVTAASSTPSTPPADITVKFTLLGDEAHGEPEGAGTTHTLKQGNLTVWIPETAITVSPNAKVIDVVVRALGLAGIPYENPDGSYIVSIRGLREFTNGSLSGWIYKLNGSYPTLSVAEQSVKNGDRIVFHYTDDYNKDTASELWGGSSGGGVSGGVSSTATPKVTIEKGADGKPVAKVEPPKNVRSAAVSVSAAKLGEGNVLAVVNADGSETVIKKSLVESGTAYALVNGNCTVKLVDNSKAFADTMNHWGKDAVAFAAGHELFLGVSADTFAPDTSMSRAMLATVLYRLEDAAPGDSNPFADVKAGMWYTDAVTWANANAIVNGTGNGFAPDRDITRQELVVMLYRYAKHVGMDTAKTTSISGYADSGEVSDWANEAMGWAVAVGLVSGRSATTLAPTGTATRAEVAVIMQRLVTLMVK